jgi:hypothetical protein
MRSEEKRRQAVTIHSFIHDMIRDPARDWPAWAVCQEYRRADCKLSNQEVKPFVPPPLVVKQHERGTSDAWFKAFDRSSPIDMMWLVAHDSTKKKERKRTREEERDDVVPSSYSTMIVQ